MKYSPILQPEYGAIYFNAFASDAVAATTILYSIAPFFSNSDTMDATEVNVHIEEDFTTPSDPKPGDQISKKPRVVNDSNVNCYVRMRVNVTNEDLLDPISVNSGWTLKSDGFYYWNSVLKPGEKTGNLFENVRIKSDALKEDIHDLDVLVYAEAVQAGSNSADSAWATMD